MLRILLPLLFATSCLFAQQTHVAVLVDQSLSVEVDNRDEALDMIVAALQGKLSSELSKKWRFIPDATHDHNPERQKTRAAIQGTIAGIFASRQAAPLVADPKLLIGPIGDLETVMRLDSSEWNQAALQNIRTTGQQFTPSDKETHLGLARSMAADRLAKKDRYYLFVVSDGVEDLVNWPAYYYLDTDKLSNPAALEAADFRDSKKQKILIELNQRIQRGENVTIGGKTRTGYPPHLRSRLKNFKQQYHEQFIGRFALNANELQTFFTKYTNKVPVFVSVYYNSPKEELEVEFVTPLGTNPDKPHAINRDKSLLEWTVNETGVGAPSLEIEIKKDGSSKPETHKLKPPERQINLFDLFPGLDSGTYAVTLTALADQHQSQSIVYVRYDAPKIPVPRLVFSEEHYQNATKAPFPLKELGQDFLKGRIQWEWVLNGQAVDQQFPKTLSWKLTPWDPESPNRREEGTEYQLNPSEPELGIGTDLFNELSSPFGNAFKLTLTWSWTNRGASSEFSESTLIAFPEPDLRILGKQGVRSNIDHPRLVKRNDVIKLGNWMHGIDNLRYSRVVVEGDDDDDPPVLAEVNDDRGTITVNRRFKGDLHYRILLNYYIDGQNDAPVEVATAEGYIRYKGRSWLVPVLFGVFASAALGFFLWNWKSSRR